MKPDRSDLIAAKCRFFATRKRNLGLVGGFQWKQSEDELAALAVFVFAPDAAAVQHDNLLHDVQVESWPRF